MEECIDYLRKATIFSISTPSPIICSWKLKLSTKARRHSDLTMVSIAWYICRLVWKMFQRLFKRQWTLSWSADDGCLSWSTSMTSSFFQGRLKCMSITWHKSWHCCNFLLWWILKLADATGRLTRWQLRLQEFDFDIVHRTGVKHQATEALSWLPIDGTDITLLYDELPVLVIGSCDKMKNISATIVALETHTSTHVHSISNDEGTDATPTTLVEVPATQSAEDVLQAIARRFSHAGT